MVIPLSQSSFRMQMEHNLAFGESSLSLPDIGVECDEMSQEPFSHDLFSVVAYKEL